MKNSATIKTTVYLIFTNNARTSLNYPYSSLYKLGTRDFTLTELKNFGTDLTTKEFIKNSCFSSINFSSTTKIEYSTDKQEPSEQSQVFIFATKKESSESGCSARNISDCAYNIQRGLCPKQHINCKLFETFHKEH